MWANWKYRRSKRGALQKQLRGRPRHWARPGVPDLHAKPIPRLSDSQGTGRERERTPWPVASNSVSGAVEPWPPARVHSEKANAQKRARRRKGPQGDAKETEAELSSRANCFRAARK